MRVTPKALRSSRKAHLRETISQNISPVKDRPSRSSISTRRKRISASPVAKKRAVRTHSKNVQSTPMEASSANFEQQNGARTSRSSHEKSSTPKRGPKRRKNATVIESSDSEMSEKAIEAVNGVGHAAMDIDNDEVEDEELVDSDENDSFEANEEWISALMKQYVTARKKFEKIVASKGKAAFKKSCQTPFTYRTHNGTAPEPFDLRDNLIKDQSLAFLRTDNNAVVQKCSVIPIEKVESTPVMQYWTLTEVNVIADDEFTLSHIPFLGDTEDDTEFCTELHKTFPDGIHGTKIGCGKYINDWILYYMVKAVKVVLSDLDLDTIFRCVHKQFPNKASAQGLAEMYPDLQIRFEPEAIVRQDLTNADGELIANFSASRLLNSYEVLICHKCFSYDCTMHNATVNENYNTKRRFSKTFSREDKEMRHCSPSCYLSVLHKSPSQRRSSGEHAKASKAASSNQSSSSHTLPAHQNNSHRHRESPTKKDLARQLNVDIFNGVLHSPNSNNNNSFSGSANDSFGSQGSAAFTPHEEALFNVLRSTGPEHFCKITKIFNMCSTRKKTCRELYEYASRKTPLSPRLDLIQSPVKAGKKKVDTHRMFRAVKWASANGKVENNCKYQPCECKKGECKKENGCRCVTVSNLCTKYCPCNEDCQNRFPGCRCAPGNCRTRQCQCYFASWECDPDICKSCNCDKFDGCHEPICKNVSIQRGLQKRLLVAPSQVAGWGCFCQEDIEKNEFISEYCGEVISQGESERRGKIYDKIKCSYLFGLNDRQVVDATRVGNVIRFANHSCNPNCRAKVIVVNGDHKIGIFANRRINRGEELFFDYAYNKSQQVQFLSKELPKNFYA